MGGLRGEQEGIKAAGGLGIIAQAQAATAQKRASP